MRFLSRARLSGFRCYEDESLELGEVTIFAGPNNAGKSAFLNALRRLVTVNLNRHPPTANPGGAAFFGPSTYLKLAPNDTADGVSTCVLTLTVEQAAFSRATKKNAPNPEVRNSTFGKAPWPIVVRAEFDPWRGTLLSQGKSPQAADAAKKVDPQAHGAIRLIEELPIIVLPERRSFSGPLEISEVTQTSSVHETAFTADSLLPLLIEWQCTNPKLVNQVESLAEEVLGSPIRISCHPRVKDLRVAVGGDPPRSVLDVGSGIVEVLILAVALTKHDGGLLLYEEPEHHLHPAVQRRLINVVRKRCETGSWQAIVTTHSNHILDFQIGPAVRRFEVRPGKGSAHIVRADRDRAAMLAVVTESLGARPSSMLAANTVIWVEGPSDAIYLGYFISQRAAEREISIEPVDYCFAFFGGANLKHVRLAAQTPEQVVDLFAVHPRSFVVFDSDRASSAVGLGKEYATKFMSTTLAGRVWITEGREVENYLADEVLAWAAMGKPDGGVASKVMNRQFAVFYEQVLELKLSLGRERAAHDASDNAKVSFARSAVEMMRKDPNNKCWLGSLDLRDRLDSLITFIRASADGVSGAQTQGQSRQ